MSSRFRTKTAAAEMAKGLNVESLRKLAATLLAACGCSTHEIGAITGHKTLARFEHYTTSTSFP